ncbi:MAG: hypothetical protein U9R15_18030 [Chloroflexota bacterium]|nr:hypothetical protein [Chloroflexota bacterium]
MVNLKISLRRKSVSVVLLVLGSILMAGCGESLPETVEIHGKVTWEGKPLNNGTVIFESVGDGPDAPLRPAKGYLNSDGTYRLSTFRTNDGAMPGQYAVLIHAFTSAPSIEAMGPPPKSAIPASYGRSDTSGLSAIVPADGTTELEINFDLPIP